MKESKIKKIRENITEVEFQKLLTYLRGSEILNKNTKINFTRTFTLLYFTGCRLNEIKQLKIKDIKTIFSSEELIILTPKTNKERKLFFSKNAIKEIKKCFELKNLDDNDFIIGTKGDYSKVPSDITYITAINKFIQKVLGERSSSHSFRSGLITDMSKTINAKFIKEFIGHSDISTTMRYIKPTDSDLRGCLIR